MNSWPDPVNPEIGWWFAPCCIEDLHQLITIDDVEWALDHYEEGGGRFYPTLESALYDLQQEPPVNIWPTLAR